MTVQDVIHISKLVNLNLSEEEIEKFRIIIPKALDAINILSQLDTEGVEPTFTVIGSRNVFLDESSSCSLTQEEALSNAKNKENGLFVTQAVIKK